MEELKVGNKRSFTFKKEIYEIKEIIENPDVTMKIIAGSIVCPHCKEKIESSKNYTFRKIEILIDENKKIEEINVDDLVILGDSLDKKKMLISKDLYNKILEKSLLFKRFLKE